MTRPRYIYDVTNLFVICSLAYFSEHVPLFLDEECK